ncbi:MAG: tetratricopeptide repeat protein [Candidatus Acidiferrum sp.]
MRNLLPTLLCLVFALPACSQDTGSEDKAFFGRGTEITITVHDGSGDPISTPAMVKLYRGGTVLSRQGETTRGSAVLVVSNLGDFTVTVQAAGYENAQKDLSVEEPGRVQLDIYLRRSADAGTIAGVPGRPVLAPKAKNALEKGLQALNANQWKEAEKYVGEAMRLAPGHPDVLYVQGVLRLKQRNWPQAQDALEKATQVDPNYAKAFAALGMALCDQGKYADAIAPLEKSLQLDAAGTWETRWALAKAYYQGARYDDALKSSQQALATSNGKSPEIALLVAQSLAAVGRFEDAAQLLREFLRDHADQREAATARKWLQGLAANGKIRANQN